jgi:hypothetical protein
MADPTHVMTMPRIRLGGLRVSRLIAGSNAISGFWHQTEERSRAMRRYFTAARIKEHLAERERNGVNAIVARADNFVMRMLAEYWDEGGVCAIQRIRPSKTPSSPDSKSQFVNVLVSDRRSEARSTSAPFT